MKVSVILPSLNVKKYISECLESVISQSMTDLEIICVDAGSTDGTLEVLREYQAIDSRIRVLVSEKKSYGYQMNLGIDNASGEYIGIVETDDYVPSNMYGDLYHIAVENDADFVKADFYRFTGNGDTLSKAHYKLTNSSVYYNRVINILHNQEAFRFTMNTWSGIYRRSFLIEHNIRHNETLGASYQDNGFWFQTFMFAKRAYFVDVPYYMNRRDNENSSVYSKGKVYCICDEYDNLFSIISRNKKLFDDFGTTFSYACFMAYKSNLNRIGDEFKEEFLKRFSDDFKRYRNLGLLDMKKYGEPDWNMIQQILDDPKEYYENSILKEELFLETARSYNKIIIYGVGMVGRRVYERLVYCEKPANVICFAVTRSEENYDTYKGVPIKEIKCLTEHITDCCIIIGTTPVYHEDIRKTLDQYGFENIICAPYYQNKDEKYYIQLNREEREAELKHWYEVATGKTLDLINAQTVNEKIQWMKLNDHSPLKEQLSDKVILHKYIADKIGTDHMHKLYGVYEDAYSIPYEILPDIFFVRFGHFDHRIIVDKTKGMDINSWEIKARRLNVLLKQNRAYTPAMELWFRNAIPRIIVEVPDDRIDFSRRYKLICSNGIVRYVFSEINCSYADKWDNHKRDIYDRNWNYMNMRLKYPNSGVIESRPGRFDEMIDLAETVSCGLDFDVVIIYCTYEYLYFDDIRFAVGSGVNYEDGEMIVI